MTSKEDFGVLATGILFLTFLLSVLGFIISYGTPSYATQSTSFSDVNLDLNAYCTSARDGRSFDMYLERKCKPKFKHNCVSSFDCPKHTTRRIKGKCIYGGVVYSNFEIVRDRYILLRCFGALGKLKFVGYAECPEDFGVKVPNSCYWGQTDVNKCSSTFCPLKYNDGDKRLKVCRYMNKLYRYGEAIPIQTPCIQCLCNDGWSDVHTTRSKGCKRKKCLKRPDFSTHNCIGVYQTDVCCPVDYICYQPALSSCTEESKGNKYDIFNATCTCLYPPLYTCIRQ